MLSEKAFDYSDESIKDMNLDPRTMEIGIHPVTKATEQNQELQFEDFAHYIRLGDLEKDKHIEFRHFLKALFEATHEFWKPAQCTKTKELDKVAQQLVQTQFPTIHIEPRRFSAGLHYWLVATLPDVNQELIIDPFGIPIPNSDYVTNYQSILPFFGIAEYAPNNAGEVFYAQGQPLGALGYQRFVP